MSTYCAPCLADLALVREAVTAVGGTAACTAHAVLLSHPGDHPQRRLTRLGDLRTLAEGKLADASLQDAPALELLVQEYALAGAMDMTVPLKELAGDRSPRPPKTRRNRPGRGDRPEGERHERPEGERRDRPEGERRDRGPRPPRGDRPSHGAVVPATDAGVHVPGAGPTSQDSGPAPVHETQDQGSVPSAPAPDAPSAPVPAPVPAPTPSAPVPAPTPSAPVPAPTPDAPSAPTPDAPSVPQQDSSPVQSTAPADSSLPASSGSAASED